MIFDVIIFSFPLGGKYELLVRFVVCIMHDGKVDENLLIFFVSIKFVCVFLCLFLCLPGVATMDGCLVFLACFRVLYLNSNSNVLA